MARRVYAQSGNTHPDAIARATSSGDRAQITIARADRDLSPAAALSITAAADLHARTGYANRAADLYHRAADTARRADRYRRAAHAYGAAHRYAHSPHADQPPADRHARTGAHPRRLDGALA